MAIFTMIFGFLAPFVPEVFKYFQRKQDATHELAMAEVRFKYAKEEHTWKMEEISAAADIEEMRVLRQPVTSFGVQLLDAAHAKALPKWVLSACFVLFAFLDALNIGVRAVITYAFVGLYLAVKWAQYRMFFELSSDITTAKALVYIWHEEDLAVLTLVLSYWFGQRTAKWAFGKKA